MNKRFTYHAARGRSERTAHPITAERLPRTSATIPPKRITLDDLAGTACTIPSDHKRQIVSAGQHAAAVAFHLGYLLDLPL